MGLFATIAVLLSLGVGAAWAADPMPVDEYWRQIDRLADLLKDDPVDAPAVAAAAEALAAVEVLVLSDGQVLPVSNGHWLDELRQGNLAPGDLTLARARLVALTRARDSASGRASLTSDETFEHLEDILSRPEFSEGEMPVRGKSLLQRVLEWLGRLFRRAQGEPGINLLFTLLAVAVVLAGLVYVFRGSLRQWAAEGQSQSDDVPGAEADLSSRRAGERAQSLAVAGDYRQAVRYLYLSTLLWLDEHRLLVYDASLTNREFLDQVAGGVAKTGLHEALVPVVELFDRVWYGFMPLDGRGYAAYVRQVERVRQVRG